MSINMTVKGGTTRTFPQQGDEDLFGEVTSWASDMTTAINVTPILSQVATYDAIVGSAANVTAGTATHSDIATAIAAVAANDRIFLLENTFEPAAQIDINKALTIVGQGEGADIQGDNIAAGAVVKISASGVTLENCKITQGVGTPDYALEIDSALERINLDIKADGTFAIALFLNGSDVGAICGFISYDTSSVFFGGESQMVEQIKIQDQTTAAYNLNIQSDSDGSVLSADRILTIDCNDGARNLDLAENFTIGNGYDVSITSEDAAGSIVLDYQTLEIEGEGTATRLFKIINSSNSARTLTFAADVTATGNALTLAIEDAAGSITLDNCSLEVEDTIGSGNTIKFIIGTDDASRTVTLSENLIVGDGYDFTLTSEDAAGSIVLDYQTLEIAGEGTATRLMTLANANDAAATLTIGGTSGSIDQDVTSGSGPAFTSAVLTTPDINGGTADELTNLSIRSSGAAYDLEFDTAEVLTGDHIISWNVGDGDRTLTFNENFTIGDGYDVTITAEDAASSITLDEQTVEFEGEGTATQLTKFINALNAAATLTISGTTCSIDQNVTSTGTPSFDSVTTDLITVASDNLELTTTTSGDININSVDETVVISSASATNATTNTIKFGDDTGGISGIRNNSGTIEFQDLGAGWTSLAGAIGATAALDNLAAVAINDSLISDTDSTDDLGSSAISWKDTYSDSYYIENGAQILSTKHVNVAADFPDSVTLYGWNHGAVGSWADEDWVGATALTEVGAIGTATNHLGTANAYIDFDGTNDEVYAGVATFDSANESFSTGGWFYFDRTGTDEYLISKDEADNADKSFLLHHDGTGTDLSFDVYYDNAAANVSLTIDDVSVTDSEWHHIVGVYDQANTLMKLYVDGECVASVIDANLATRNNGTTSELCFGGRYDTATATVEIPFDGKITDMFYKIDVLTDNEVKKLYAGGSQKLVVEDGGTNEVHTLGLFYKENVFGARIANGGAATITRQSTPDNPAIASVNRSALGTIVFTFTTNYFSEAPTVTATTEETNVDTNISPITTTGFTTYSIVHNSGTYNDADVNVTIIRTDEDYIQNRE